MPELCQDICNDLLISLAAGVELLNFRVVLHVKFGASLVHLRFNRDGILCGNLG
jgi:hypothetical protein